MHEFFWESSKRERKGEKKERRRREEGEKRERENEEEEEKTNFYSSVSDESSCPGGGCGGGAPCSPNIVAVLAFFLFSSSSSGSVCDESTGFLSVLISSCNSRIFFWRISTLALSPPPGIDVSAIDVELVPAENDDVVLFGEIIRGTNKVTVVKNTPIKIHADLNP